MHLNSVKIALLLLIFLVALLAGYPFLNHIEKSETVTGLPWQIDILPDGSTRVFGVHIGGNRLSDVTTVLGDDMELAVIAAGNEVGRLEMYYGHYRAGLLSGKLILMTDANLHNIKNWRDRSTKSDYVGNGRAKKYYLSDADLDHAFNESVTGLIFIPAANLDDEIIGARFGEPAERIESGEVTYFLYPQLGLVVTLHKDAKEVIHYVSPSEFHLLSRLVVGDTDKMLNVDSVFEK